MFDLHALAASETSQFAGFTFPAYRHLLNLEPYVNATQDATQPDSEIPRRPFALGAFAGGSPAGLLLGSTPVESSEEMQRHSNPELLSLFVAPNHRQRGLGLALVQRGEELLRQSGQRYVHATYMTGKPSIAWIERILSQQGWSEPHFRFATARFSYERIQEATWLRRLPIRKGYQVVPWHEIGDDEKRAARESHAKSPWISEPLLFWKFSPDKADEATSLGIRYQGEFVGWVLNHAFKNSTILRFSSAFIRWDLARLGLAFPAVARSIDRMPLGGYTQGTFVTPKGLARMRATIDKYVAPWADYVGESRGIFKELPLSD